MTSEQSPPDRAHAPFGQFNFQVDFGNGRIAGFQDASGLDAGVLAVEYRGSTSPGDSAAKLPGLAKSGNVILRRGLLAPAGGIRGWFDLIGTGRIERRAVAIRLIDEAGRPVMTWTLANAWPVAMVGPGSGRDGAEIVIESLELAHKGIASVPG